MKEINGPFKQHWQGIAFLYIYSLTFCQALSFVRVFVFILFYYLIVFSAFSLLPFLSFGGEHGMKYTRLIPCLLLDFTLFMKLYSSAKWGDRLKGIVRFLVFGRGFLVWRWVCFDFDMHSAGGFLK